MPRNTEEEILGQDHRKKGDALLKLVALAAYGQRGEHRVDFTVPGGAGSYAPEVIYLNPEDVEDATQELARVFELQVHIEALPADAEIEVDVLRAGGDPETAGDWLTAVQAYASTGLHIRLLLEGQRVRLRAKSGGTGGSAPVNAWWV